MLTGCAQWTEPAAENPLFPTTRMSPRTVVLEICTIRLQAEDRADAAEIWTEVDEQHLPVGLGRHLAHNGIRCGLFGTRLPAAVNRLLDQPGQPVESDLMQPVPIDFPTLVTKRRLHSRAGQAAKIICSSVRDRMAVLIQEDGRVGGETFRDAQCLFVLKTYPQGDGRVRIQLTPEIHHGQPRQQISSEYGAMFVVASRLRRAYETLLTETMLSPGETLLFSCTPEVKGLGSHFFIEDRGQGQPTQKLLLIRLSQTQFDDDIVPENVATPFVASGGSRTSVTGRCHADRH